MIVKTASTTFLKFAHDTAFSTRKYLTITGLCASVCLLAPVGAHAGGLSAGIQVAPAAQMALQEWPDPTALPDAKPDQPGERELQSLTEEASKQAQVRYLAAKWGRSPKTLREYVNLAWEEAGKREGLDPELLIAIMQKESSLSARVQSRQGAQGLMQVIRRWHSDKLHPSESLFDPRVNIRVGADILEEYLELAGGSLHQALEKYSGNARGYANTILKESRKLARVADRAAAAAAVAMTQG
ncbi:transglycosylase SLT domain-containing protein [Parapusillimonas granuli]|nr:transglycosylase SLT domain-containing protein [Parapusillimonas granuli]MBB5213362.1 soluble lytic murein transglycosylase-like protein [Parapusillimonas granuli]